MIGTQRVTEKQFAANHVFARAFLGLERRRRGGEAAPPVSHQRRRRRDPR